MINSDLYQNKGSSLVKCYTCRIEFKRSNSKLRVLRHGFTFCGRRCKEKAQSLGGLKEIQPAHYGRGEGKYSYRKLAFDTYPHKCNRCDYCKVIDILRVHHIDRNRLNNKIQNLEILCPTCHDEEHFLSEESCWTKQKI